MSATCQEPDGGRNLRDRPNDEQETIALDDNDATPATKRCPLCAEEIQAAAVRCRFCGANLGNDSTRTRSLASRWARWIGTVAAVSVLAGVGWYFLVGPEDHVYVTCAGSTSGSVTCSTEHKQGRRKVGACWDFAMRCKNGQAVTARACSEVRPEQHATTIIPASDMKGLDTCDTVVRSSVENLTMSVLP